MKSITYWHPFIYSLMVRFFFKEYYSKRYEVLRGLIENNSTVVDVCCGDCKIVEFLKDKNIDYTGLDFNDYFVKTANAKGINARSFDIRADDVPEADYVLIIGSLYQFMPNHSHVLHKLLSAAKRHLIISEPIRNYTHSKSRFVAYLATMMTNPGDGAKPYRFNEETFKKALTPFQKNIVKEFIATNDKEYIAVLRNG